MGEYRESLITFEEKMLDLSQDQHNKKLVEGWAYNGAGIAYEKLGKRQEAIEHAEKRLGIAQELGDEPGQGQAFANLAIAYQNLGMYKEAIEYAKDHLKIVERLGNSSEQGLAYASLGSIWSKLGMYRRAIDFHEKSLEIYDELPDEAGRCRAYGHLSYVHSKSGRYKLGIINAKKYLEIASKLNNISDQRIAHGILGVCYARSENLDLARENFEESYQLVRQLEEQLVDGEWRRHLLTFGEDRVRFMDEWVVTCAQSKMMEEALWVEERRRCRSELAYQTDVVQGGQDVSPDELKSTAKNADAAFIIVMKLFGDSFLVWVLSGESGELVFSKSSKIARIEKQGKEISECVNRVTFAEWEQWQKQLIKAQKSLEERGKEPNGVIPTGWLESEIKKLIPENMKGDLDERLWESVRNPKTFKRVVALGGSPEISALHTHFLRKAEYAMGRLNALMWKPIVENCRAVKAALESETRCDRPVSGMMRVGASDLWGRLTSGTALNCRLGVETDLLFARPFFVADSLCCIQGR